VPASAFVDESEEAASSTAMSVSVAASPEEVASPPERASVELPASTDVTVAPPQAPAATPVAMAA
jgi:hypothetical protein